MQENVLNSVIASTSLDTNANGIVNLSVRGYAISGTTPVSAIEVSIDRGVTWHPTDIIYQEGRWSWVLWQSYLPIPEEIRNMGKIVVWSRAIDKAGTRQFLDCEWNFRGVAYTGPGEAILSTLSE
jgi:sulfite oxidase